MRRIVTIFTPLLILAVPARNQTVEGAEQLIRAGNLTAARDALGTIVERDPQNAEARYRLAMLMLSPVFEDGEDEAEELIEVAVELDPDNADYQYGLGAVYGVKAQRSGMLKQAMLAPKIKNAFLKATQLNPAHVQARIALIQYYRMAPGIMGGDDELARKHLDTLVKLDNLVGRIFRARMLEREKEFDKAEQELRQLAAEKRSDDRVWKAVGSFHLRRGNPDEAIRAFATYVKLRPDTADSHNALGEAYMKKGDLERARELFDQALRRDADFGPSLLNAGDVCRMTNQTEKAREFYRLVLAKDQSQWRRKEADQRLKELE